MNFNFGIPLKREKKTEKYDFPVLVMQKEPEFKGARRFLLNKSAMELLGLSDNGQETVSVGFPQQNDGRFVIAKTTGITEVPTKFKYNVHKTENSFSNGPLYNAIKKELNLDLTSDVEFIIREDNSLQLMNDNVGAITYKEQEAESEAESANQIKLEI